MNSMINIFFFLCLTGIFCCAQLRCIFNLINNKVSVRFHWCWGVWGSSFSGCGHASPPSLYDPPLRRCCLSSVRCSRCCFVNFVILKTGLRFCFVFFVRTGKDEVMLRRILQMVRFRWQKSNSVGFVWLLDIQACPCLSVHVGRAIYHTLRCGWVGFSLITTGSSLIGVNIRYSVTS